MSRAPQRPWIFCQLGAREHYVLPRELHRRGLLRALVTDAWAAPGGWASRMPGRLGARFSERYTPDLADARVVHFTGSLMRREAASRLGRARPPQWDTIMARNAWFQKAAVAKLRSERLLEGRPVVFAYSYAARDILAEARAAGCMTVLGQIDPAIAEEDIVADAVAANAPLGPDWDRAPPRYWDMWREECALADRIIVNSQWSRIGLERAGIDPARMRVVPLAYEGAGSAPRAMLPDRFGPERPLRVLFLGSLIIRKGIAELIAAARLLHGLPVEIHLVGSPGIEIPPQTGDLAQLHVHPPVSREAVHAHFAAADLFLLPSLSDGFGLTMIEAQAHGLPVIASRQCGEVVREGIDGVLLDEVSGPAIAEQIKQYLEHPSRIAQHALAASDGVGRFAPATIGDRLVDAVRMDRGNVR